MLKSLPEDQATRFDRAFVVEAIGAIEALSDRSTVNPGPGHFRALTEERIADIKGNYESAANAMYEGLTRRLTIYAKGADPEKKRIAECFEKAGGTIRR